MAASATNISSTNSFEPNVSDLTTEESEYFRRDSKDIETVNEVKFQDLPGEIIFNQTLIPRGLNAVTLNCKIYKPNVNSEFYFQIEKAIEQNVRFALCIVDVRDSQILRTTQLIQFCKSKSIPIFAFEYSNNICVFEDIPSELKALLPKNQPRLIKETFSIFSVPKFHRELTRVKPDALIVAGSIGECCIKASILGTSDDFKCMLWHDKEYGAVQYGIPVYTQSRLIFSHTKLFDELEHPLLYKFDDITDHIRPQPHIKQRTKKPVK
ncbi:cysteine hydrolase [Parashewanella spongiae]|nr:isochorismatase family protein [Parashewanella spongiae]MCL1076620.1 cysteine hydrolase [Parashewanella spongiae]